MTPSPLWELSVLVTREEYSDAAAHQKRARRRRTAPLITVIGGILTAAGLAGVFFGSQISLSPAAAFCLILLGLFLICYDGLFAPVMDRAAAAREYEEKQDLHFTSIYIFYPDSFTIQNSRIQGDIPFSLLTCWSETPASFVMAVGRELNIAIPKRIMSPEQCRQLSSLLEKKAGGVRW